MDCVDYTPFRRKSEWQNAKFSYDLKKIFQRFPADLRFQGWMVPFDRAKTVAQASRLC